MIWTGEALKDKGGMGNIASYARALKRLCIHMHTLHHMRAVWQFLI